MFDQFKYYQYVTSLISQCHEEPLHGRQCN